MGQRIPPQQGPAPEGLPPEAGAGAEDAPGQVGQVVEQMAMGFDILGKLVSTPESGAPPEAAEMLGQSQALFADAMRILSEGVGGEAPAGAPQEQGVPFGPGQQA